ncbi:hypothetical protein D3C81_2206630 [compost metagenome]
MSPNEPLGDIGSAGIIRKRFLTALLGFASALSIFNGVLTRIEFASGTIKLFFMV